MQETPLLACEGSGLRPESEDDPDPGLDENTGTSAERGLTMKDLQILVDQRVVRVAEDALVAVHDIPETVATGAVPSAADMERFFTKWLEQVQLSVAASVEMAKQRGMPLPPDSGNASLLLYSRESQNGFVHWIGATQQLKKAAQEEKVWVLEFVWSGSARVGWEVRVFDAKRTPTHRFPQH